MLTMNLQLFAHKKGTGSSHNGRDSESKRLGAKRADGTQILREIAWALQFYQPRHFSLRAGLSPA